MSKDSSGQAIKLLIPTLWSGHNFHPGVTSAHSLGPHSRLGRVAMTKWCLCTFCFQSQSVHKVSGQSNMCEDASYMQMADLYKILFEVICP